MREKVSLIRPMLRDEVKEPRISRFDPQSRADLQRRGAVRRTASAAPRSSRPGPTQVLQKRLENVRGVGSVTRGRRPGAADQHLPASRRRWRRSASASTRWSPRCAARTRSCRSARSARRSRSGWCRSMPASSAPRTSATSSSPARASVARQRRRRLRISAPVRLWQVADIVDGPQEVREPGALQRPAHGAARRCRSRRARTRSRSSTACSRRCEAAKPLMPPGRQGRGQPRQLALDPRLGRQRQAHPVRRRGADDR